MTASDVISEIIKRMKFWGGRFPTATTSFIPNTKGDSYYLIQNRGENNLPVQIRISNHGTYLETWTDRKELGESVDRIDPAHSINISIVFVDNGKSITNDCDDQVNCEGCVLPVCKPQTFDGQNEIGRPFKVFQYVYQSDDIASRYINALTKAIFHARYTGEYIDPLKDLPRAAKPKEFDSTNLPKWKKTKYSQTENKQYKSNTNMNKKLIRLTESDLHRIVKESVNRILSEANNHLISVGGVEDTPFTRNNNKGSNSIRINGVFNTTNYSNNPSRAAIEMMQDKLPFDEFIDYCEQRGISPYDYIDTNDFEVEQWIEDYI